ncbi:MAG: hypothetical protein ACOYM3_11955 [Terrimicrobiaceae bacterium]
MTSSLLTTPQYCRQIRHPKTKKTFVPARFFAGLKTFPVASTMKSPRITASGTSFYAVSQYEDRLIFKEAGWRWSTPNRQWITSDLAQANALKHLFDDWATALAAAKVPEVITVVYCDAKLIENDIRWTTLISPPGYRRRGQGALRPRLRQGRGKMEGG